MINSTHITLRVSPELRSNFRDRAIRYGRPSDVLREIIEAFTEGRLVIEPNPSKENLYVTRNPNK